VAGRALAPGLGDRERRLRLLAHEALVDPHQAGVLELGQMAREVALGEPGRPLQEQEVGVGDRGEHGQDREPSRLVDEAVELSHRRPVPGTRA